ncbi:flagellar assembly protein FliW [Clostridium niameyense]|uniref:flagellar assembly protein FliW n=1 Tax=Clostridium niameyense TaxID=1622073 RepID=UPI00067EB770|nr:flagellar assembly protein FliW [Clostridium niameyense]
MKINTKCYDALNYEEKDAIYFQKGIPGFEKLKKFIIFPVEDNDIFSVFHSIEDENIGIIVISPFHVKKDYEIKLEEDLIKRLKIKNEEEVLILNTVTLSSVVNEITVNLKAPIIINIKEKLGEQIIVDNDNYKIKHPIFKEEA